MSFRKTIQWSMIFVAASLTTAAHAQWGQELKPGSKAPALDIERWIAGEPVNALESGTVYLVEFWATWCPPCRAAIPKLNALQREFEDQGLVVIGVSTDEKVETVESFVRAQYGSFHYRIAFDRQGGTKRSWLDAAGKQGIPWTFVVDRDGVIQHIGNPHDEELPFIIELVLQGRYNAKLFEEVLPTVGAFLEARRVRNYSLAFRHLDEIIDRDSHVFAPFNLLKFEIMMVDRNDPEQAYAFAAKIMEHYAGDAPLLAELAQKIAHDPKIKDENRRLDVAMKAAEAAQRAGRPNDPAILATLALVHFHKGNVPEAISLQRRAWMIATPTRKPYYERSLRSYQQAQQRHIRMQGGG